MFGAGGQLASELATTATAEGVALKGVRRETADITVSEQIARAMAETGPSLAINAAAYNLVDKAESEPGRAMAVNGDGPGMLAAACVAAGVPLVHISTDYVFDGEKTGPYREDDPVAPTGAYGRSKAAGEAAVRDAMPDHLILRTAWLFGIHGSNFLKTVLRLAAERDAIDMVADQVGSPTSTRDLARAILIAAEAIDRGTAQWGTYHVAGSGAASRHDFASRIVEVQARFTARRPRVNPVMGARLPAAARRPKNSVLDSAKFATVFGFHAADWRSEVDRVVTQLFAPGGKP
ncbi:MAG: dTDP-4-dehydrorhamnose reductase [Bauldia sp.]